jgi:hypothetical protein
MHACLELDSMNHSPAHHSHDQPSAIPGYQTKEKSKQTDKQANNKTKCKEQANKPAIEACRLLNEGAPGLRTLLKTALPMCEQDFLNLCEERALAHKCGNPLCANAVLTSSPEESVRIDWKTLEMVKVSVDQFWCSTACRVRCCKVARSLGSPVDRLDVLRRLQAPPSGADSHARTAAMRCRGCKSPTVSRFMVDCSEIGAFTSWHISLAATTAP